MHEKRPDEVERQEAQRSDSLYPSLSRRVFLTATGAVGTSLLAPRFSGMSGSGEARAAEHMHNAPADTPDAWKEFIPGAPFVEPEVRRSVNGALDTTLRLQYAYMDIGGYRLFMRTYEGTIPGPTLRVKPGDVLRIDQRS